MFPSAPPRTTPPRGPSRPVCRAIAVEGDARLDLDADASTTIAVQERILGNSWIALSPAARLVVREPKTARETTVRGPGRARMCVDSQNGGAGGAGDESWLAAGDFESSPGSGEYPGAEQWVVTAQGVVRYAAAKVTVHARPGSASLAVAEGAAFVWAADDAGIAATPATTESEGWQRVASGGRATLTAKAPSKALSEAARNAPDAARAAAAQCLQLATRARKLAVALLTPSLHAADDPLPSEAGAGGPAGEQVRTRRLARAACAVAHLRAESLTEPARGGEGLAQMLREGDSAWRDLPEEEAPAPGEGPARRAAKASDASSRAE